MLKQTYSTPKTNVLELNINGCLCLSAPRYDGFFWLQGDAANGQLEFGSDL